MMLYYLYCTQLTSEPCSLSTQSTLTTTTVYRYKELKKEGKLNKFMEKKRKKNSNKDHRWMPARRSEA